MEPEVVKTERRGRKRKRKDGQGADKTAKKTAVETRSKVFVGRYVKKEFDGNGVFLGKIVSYDTGLYRVDYEDGDCEDLESGEVKAFIIGDNDMDGDFHKRKRALDEYILKKYAKDEAVGLDGAANEVETVRTDGGVISGVELANADKVETVRSDGGGVGNGVELANADKVESSIRGGAFELSGAQPEVDSEASSDISDYEQSGEPVEVERPSIPPPQLPPSSGNFGVSEEHVSYLLSVYSFLRSFSVCLFLSPFGLDEFVGALNSTVPNALLDAIHVALMRALKSHVEILSSEGSELASKCLRSMDWSLLDSLTWPVFIVQYLMTMKYAEGPEWKEFFENVLEKDYYTLSAGRKLIILQLLCDDALCSAELRAEYDMREGIEVGPDPDGVIVFADESISRRAHPSSSNREAAKDISESHMKTLFSTAKAAGSYIGTDIDEDGNGDECRLCGMDGTLLCCDGCPSAYHTRCIGVSKMVIPEGAWYCPECAANRTGPNVTRVTTLRGAEFFGIDPYEQVFLGSCDHLLVMKASESSELHIRYYSPLDIQKVLHALTCSAEYRTLYLGICKGIMRYWEIPEHISSLADSFGIDKFFPNKMVDGEYSTPSTLLAKESSNAPDVIDTGNGNGVAELNSKDVVAAWREENGKELGFGIATLDEARESHQSYEQLVEGSTQLGNYTISVGANTETVLSTCSASLQPFPSELNRPWLSGKLSMKNSDTCISENGNCNNKSDMNSAVSNMSSHINGAKLLSGGRGHGISADGCLYMGSSFKPQAYVNVYIHGDFAASAAASLAILSSEEKFPSQPQPSSSQRKFMSANYSLQTKAFSFAAKRFYWPNYEKKLVEVPRERCGWCLSCKASVSSRKGCLLNAAASNAIKVAAKILASLRQSKNMEGSLASIATYVMFMEESLGGLTVGPFLNASYRNQWHKQVEEAATLGEIKASLLEFERNIRDIAFSADWIRLVDDLGVENQVTQSAKNVAGSTHRRGPGRRGRKPAIILEVTDADGKDLSTNFAWWRGGMLSKHIFQKGILPQRMIKNAARQGGCEKINGVQYVDGVEVPKRSRQFLWRAAVEMSKTASQLALQIRYLDLHVRWNELVRPEQPLQDGKGPEAEASAFRNACIVDKKVLGNKISYGVVFGNQKHLPSRVMKNMLEVEKTGDGKEKYWFVEMRIPLYLIKEYEKEMAKVILTTADKHVSTLSNLHKRQLKASGKNIFSFLSQKKDNMGKCLCTLCQLDVPFRFAARCSACQGYCHAQCAVCANVQMGEHAEFIITCKRCYQEKVVTPQNEIVGDSPTSPLLLQGPESQHPATVIKGGKQNGYGRPLEYLNQSSEKNSTTSNRKTSRSGKQNGIRRQSESVDQSSKENGKRPPLESSEKITTNDSSVVKKNSKTHLSWGLIWKKKDPEDTGIDFRLKHLLLKGNPNGNLLAPVCHLCTKPYNCDLMYIQCTDCDRWYHADAVELKESKILELLGFKCCRCRRIRIPLCPYTDPEMRKKLEAKKKPQFKNKKQKKSKSDSKSETNDKQVKEREPDGDSVFDTEDAVNVQEDDSLYSFPKVEPVNDRNFEASGAGAGPGSVPKKLQVRRHIKSEKESDGCSTNFEPPRNHVENNPNPGAESASPIVEWDVSTNGFQDDMMFDYEDLNYEDMEFEPQTYFSFNELLASDNGDPPGDVPVNPSGEEYQMGITYDEQEPMFSVESGVDMVPCNVCSLTEPCPDLYCQTCGLWIHQHCSPWDDESCWEPEGVWKCGHCREWR